MTYYLIKELSRNGTKVEQERLNLQGVITNKVKQPERKHIIKNETSKDLKPRTTQVVIIRKRIITRKP